MKKKILYTGTFRFPNKDAAAFRVLGIAELFSKMDIFVDFAGWENLTEPYTFQRYNCFPQAELDSPRISNPFQRLMKFFFRGMKTFKWIKLNFNYDVFVLYNPPAIFALLMLLYAKRFGKKIILDSTEWYDSNHLIGGKYGFAALENWLRMRLIYPKFDNIICISAYLKDYFETCGCRNVVKIFPIKPNDIPTWVDTSRLNNELILFYAGQPGKKDILINFIKEIPIIQSKINRKVILHLAGPSLLDLKKLFVENDLDITPYIDNLFFHGFLERNKIFEMYRKAHFSILFRENKRYALAGFPTKGMESLVNGCPIIMNEIGDISSVAKNISAGLLVSNSNGNDIAILIEEMVFDRSQIASRASEYFSVDANIDLFSDFINGIYHD